MQCTHAAIIPDGNRRYSEKHSLAIEQAYQQGFAKVQDAAQWARSAGVKELSVWALSLDNFKGRSDMELSVIFKIMGNRVDQALREELFQEQKTRVRFFGKLDMLPLDLRAKLTLLQERTNSQKELQLNVGLAYNGKEELLSAAKRLAVDLRSGKVAEKDITEKTFEEYLYVSSSPDLIIRTGAVSRLSGFMPWQNVYSELYFSPKLWPEFSQEDFNDAITFYESTERRFGK